MGAMKSVPSPAGIHPPRKSPPRMGNLLHKMFFFQWQLIFSLDLGLLIVIFSELKSWDFPKKPFWHLKTKNTIKMVAVFISFKDFEEPTPEGEATSRRGFRREKWCMRRFVGRTLKPQILCEKKIAWSFLVTFFGMVTLNLFERLQSGIKWVDFFHHLVVFWMIFFFTSDVQLDGRRWSTQSDLRFLCFWRLVAPITSYYKWAVKISLESFRFLCPANVAGDGDYGRMPCWISEQRKKPWLVGLYKGLYYPFILGLY